MLQKIFPWYKCSQCSYKYKQCLVLRLLLSKLYERSRQSAFFYGLKYRKKMIGLGIVHKFLRLMLSNFKLINFKFAWE